MENSRLKRQKTKLRDRAKITSLQDEVEALKQQIIALTAKKENESDHPMGEEKPKSKDPNNYIEILRIRRKFEADEELKNVFLQRCVTKTKQFLSTNHVLLRNILHSCIREEMHNELRTDRRDRKNSARKGETAMEKESMDMTSLAEKYQTLQNDLKTLEEENSKVKQINKTLEADYARMKRKLLASQEMVQDLQRRENTSNELLAQLQFRSEIETDKQRLEILFLNDQLEAESKEKLALENQMKVMEDNARDLQLHIKELHDEISWQKKIKEEETSCKEKVMKEKKELIIEMEEKSNIIENLKIQLDATNDQILSLEGQVIAQQITLNEKIDKLNRRKGWRRFKCW